MRTEVSLAAGGRLWQHAVLMLFATMIAWMPFATAAQDELLAPEKAFRISTRAADSGAVEVRFQIADGYYMYRDRFKLKRMEPTAPTDCENPIEQLVPLGRRLGATGTPTWFLPNGEKYTGAQPMSVVLPLLDATARTRSKDGPR
jgi:hypothetical protein